MNIENELNETPLHKAAQHGSYECIKYLIENGANIKIVDENLKSALHHAAENGHLECVKALLQPKSIEKSKSSTSSETKTNLMEATTGGASSSQCDNESPDCVIDIPNNPEAEVSSADAVPEQEPFLSQPAVVALDAVADVNVQDCNLNTPAHLAAIAGHFECYQFLKSVQGADPTLTNRNFKTTEDLWNELLESRNGPDIQLPDDQQEAEVIRASRAHLIGRQSSSEEEGQQAGSLIVTQCDVHQENESKSY